MTRSLKDLIQDFTPAARTEAAAVVPEAAAEAAPASFVDGPTAAAMVDWLDALASLADLLDEETAAVGDGDPWSLEAFARRKLAMAERLDAFASGPGPALAAAVAADADLRAMAAGAVERLEHAVRANAAALAAMREAVMAVNRHLIRAVETAASDGLYAASGEAVRPVELSTAGIDAEL
ncbi:MAG TPA: flagellar protein FlgN [Arenibaculum sp.]|nr:flagellar protein FlgN [Arenibaculum sp.]